MHASCRRGSDHPRVQRTVHGFQPAATAYTLVTMGEVATDLQHNESPSCPNTQEHPSHSGRTPPVWSYVTDRGGGCCNKRASEDERHYSRYHPPNVISNQGI